MNSVRLFVLCLLSGTVGAQERATLSHRPVPMEDVFLPSEVWHAVRGSIQVRGASFAIDESERGALGIDTDGDGEIDSRLHGQGGRVVLSAHLADTQAFRYVVRFRHHIKGWQWTSSGCLVARIRGQVLRLFDQDGNGYFSDFGSDAIAIGDSAAATLLSRVIRLNDALLHVSILDDAREIQVSPFDGPTGSIDASATFMSNGQLRAAIVQDGDLSFDLAGFQGPVRVPTGNYRLVSGLAVSGEESVSIRAGRMHPIRVDTDASVTLAWGGPLRAEFDYRVENDTIIVDPDVIFYGKAGEEYFAFRPCARSPHIRVLNRETGETVQAGSFGGSCGGGLSRFEAVVPSGVQLEVFLDHERSLFGKITGSSHTDTTQAAVER
ncbi:MAG: hypothetical protein ACI8QZ_002390 [Chlamydiales bacterium]